MLSLLLSYVEEVTLLCGLQHPIDFLQFHILALPRKQLVLI